MDSDDEPEYIPNVFVNNSPIVLISIDDPAAREKPTKEGDTMQDNEGTWFFEDGQWWLL